MENVSTYDQSLCNFSTIMKSSETALGETPWSPVQPSIVKVFPDPVWPSESQLW